MKRTVITLAALAAALGPAAAGLWGNASFSQAVPVRVPASGQVATLPSSDDRAPTRPAPTATRHVPTATSTTRLADDHGGDTPRDQRTEPGDDHGGSATSTRTSSSTRHSGHSSSGASTSGGSSTATGTSTSASTTVDDHGGDTPRGQRTEPGDDHGGDSGGDDHGGHGSDD
jgi:hypothetical protein